MLRSMRSVLRLVSKIDRPAFFDLGSPTRPNARDIGDDPVRVCEVAGVPTIRRKRPDVHADRNPHAVRIFVIPFGSVDHKRYAVGAHTHVAQPHDHMGDLALIIADKEKIGRLKLGNESRIRGPLDGLDGQHPAPAWPAQLSPSGLLPGCPCRA